MKDIGDMGCLSLGWSPELVDVGHGGGVEVLRDDRAERVV